MASWFEDLDAREGAARARIEELRQQIVELTESLEREQVVLSRLEVIREMVTEILARPEHRPTVTPLTLSVGKKLQPPITERHLEAEVAHCVGGVVAALLGAGVYGNSAGT